MMHHSSDSTVELLALRAVAPRAAAQRFGEMATPRLFVPPAVARVEFSQRENCYRVVNSHRWFS